jgi:hypothetical protein
MLFNGAPSFAASLYKNSESSQILSFDAFDDRLLKITAVGVPKVDMPWIKVGTCEEDAEYFDCKDSQGGAFKVKIWYDEKEGILHNLGESATKIGMKQKREITPEGNMLITATHSKQDGTSCTYTASFKKTS